MMTEHERIARLLCSRLCAMPTIISQQPLMMTEAEKQFLISALDAIIKDFEPKRR